MGANHRYAALPAYTKDTSLCSAEAGLDLVFRRCHEDVLVPAWALSAFLCAGLVSRLALPTRLPVAGTTGPAGVPELTVPGQPVSRAIHSPPPSGGDGSSCGPNLGHGLPSVWQTD